MHVHLDNQIASYISSLDCLLSLLILQRYQEHEASGPLANMVWLGRKTPANSLFHVHV